MSSNWLKLKRKLNDNLKVENSSGRKRKRQDIKELVKELDIAKSNETTITPSKIEPKTIHWTASMKSKYVAMDCEMVGIGNTGEQSALARCTIVDYDGAVIYDKFVRPPAFVTDFRTQWSGVRSKDLRQGHAITFAECQKEVAKLLENKILIGHALENDLRVLMLSHKKSMIRDTSSFRPYMRPNPKKKGKFKKRALRDLSKQFLGKTIQSGEHDSGEDARTALELYKLKRDEWEENLKETRKLIRLSKMRK